MKELTRDEIVEHSNRLLNWTTKVGEASVEDFQVASQLHILTIQNFIRLYGEELQLIHEHNYNQLKEFSNDNW